MPQVLEPRLSGQAPLRGRTPWFDGDVTPETVPEKYRLGRAFVPKTRYLDPEFLKEHFLPFVVLLHLGTAVALLLFFWRDWFDFAGSLVARDAAGPRRELLLVIIGTVPAAIIGFVLEKKLRAAC